MSAAQRDALGRGIVLGFAALLLSTGLDWGAKVDIASVGGDRVLRGEVPYRDFWTIYSPGSFYLVASLFRVFGRELAVVYVASALLAGAASLVFYALLRRAGLRPFAATLASIAFLVAAWSPSPGLESYVVPRLLLLFGWERVLRALSSEQRSPLLSAGLAFGVAAWFKHDVAAYAALGSGLTVLAWQLRARSLRERLRDVLALGLASLVPVLPGVIFVAVLGGTDAWRDLIAFPIGDFRDVRGEAYPGIVPDLGRIASASTEPENVLRMRRAVSMLSDWSRAWLPVSGLSTAAAAWLYARVATRAVGRELAGEQQQRAARAAVGLALCCAPFYWTAAHVQQNTHVFSLGVLAALALSGAWRLLPRREARVGAGFALAPIGFGLAAFALALGFGLGPAAQFWYRQHSFASDAARPLDIPGARAARVSEAEYATLRPLVDFVRANVPRDEAIYVGLQRHDAILIGDATLYFLADRASATRYHELHPGISDRDEVQREMLRDIEAAGVRCVVLWTPGLSDQRLDAILAARQSKIPELGSSWLDTQLAAKFESVAHYGAYEVLWRRNAARPWEEATNSQRDAASNALANPVESCREPISET